MELFLALTLWDIVTDVLQLRASRAREDTSRQPKPKTSGSIQESIDFVPPNASDSSRRAQFLLEDTVAVMKMIIKGGSRTCVVCQERIVLTFICTGASSESIPEKELSR